MFDRFWSSLRIFVLALFALGLSCSISVAQGAAAILFLELIFRFGRDGKWKEILTSDWSLPLGVFLGWSLVSTYLSDHGSVTGALRTQSAVLFFFLGLFGIEETERKPFARWFCIGAVAVGLWGIVQKLSGVVFLPNEGHYLIPDRFAAWPLWLIENLAVRNGRAVGPRSHPLTYAEGLVPAFFILSYAFVKKYQSKVPFWKNDFLSLAGIVIVAGGLFFSEARAVILGTVLGLLTLGWYIGRRAFALLITAMAIILFTAVLFSPKFSGRMMSIFTTKFGSAGDQQSKSIRFELWSDALRQIKEHPFRGVGTDGAVLTAFDPIENRSRTWGEAHNIYLQTALEWGLTGFGMFLWILVFSARACVQIRSPVKAPAAAVLLALLAAGFTESWTNDKEIAMIFWLFLGWVEAERRRDETA